MAIKKNINQDAKVEKLPENFKIVTPDNNINNVCNDFLETYKNINIKTSTGFNTLLSYIASNYFNNFEIKLDNIDLLDYYFEIYKYICSNCNIKPSIKGYSIYINISYETISDWLSGQNRSSTHLHVVKKWKKYCENVLYNDATNGNIGAMFGLKARYGYSETAAPQNVTINAFTTPTLDVGNIADKYIAKNNILCKPTEHNTI